MAASKRVSVLKETRAGEKRVIALPEQVREFRNAGFDVLVEADAGAGTGVLDRDYKAAGAEVVTTEQAWRESDFVLKYKAPGPHEYQYLREDLTLGAFFHAEGNPELTARLLESGTRAYAYEFFKTPEGIFPLAVPDSEISGKLAVLFAAYHLQSHLGGSGVLLADVPYVRPPRVVVIGYGNAGAAAARTAQALGADVVVLGTNRERLRRYAASAPGVRCRLNTPDVLEQEVEQADLVVGAILISTYDTPPMIDEDLVRRMKAGSVIVDVTVGYGSGYLPTFHRETTHTEPVYERFGVLHCKIDAMPGSVPHTAARAVSPLITPYLIELGNSLHEGIAAPTADNGMITEGGRMTHHEIRRHMVHDGGAAVAGAR
ncbi:NAD(P)-dependent oxidoreductase [Streptomyces luteolus]|uniref:NAD(P)-dependent oxidoreductase n=1 Tax=Streptomyces luteolus TaxID=3043615 RepID=A0ABT6SQX5_9ACTN|nr:NAD(P)-dependent oxidoreductase [Streptomyces sp. B-S-A12]MDI3418012.1 NAD(P)-dependent oxidoreductase [Streptomyces sp. B-S-A12]